MKNLPSAVTVVAAAVLVALPLVTSAAREETSVNVTGKWDLTVQTSGRIGTPTVELKQDGEKVTGTYSSAVFGEQKVTGTIKGPAITFSFSASFQGNSTTVTYHGTADATTMKGKVTVGDRGEGTFTGKRQKS